MYHPLLSCLLAHDAYSAARTDESRAAYLASEAALSAVWDEEPAVRRAAAKFGVEAVGEDRTGGTPQFFFAITPVTCKAARSHKADALVCMARAVECDQLAESALAERREPSAAFWRGSAENWRAHAAEWCGMRVVA